MKYKCTYFENKWRRKRRDFGNWTIIGITERYCSPYEVVYNFCFFGLELHIWFEKNK